VNSYDTKHGRVNIAVAFTNLGDQTTTFYDEIVLSSNDNNYVETTREHKIPSVPGTKKGDGLLSFYVDDKFAMSTAVLTFGNPKNNQAVVPFGTVGKLTSLEPHAVTVSGTLAVGESFTIDFTSGEVRSDSLKNHREQSTGHRALILNFSITRTGTAGSYIDSSNFALKMPNGTAVAPDNATYGSLPPKGTTETGKLVQFVVVTPTDGAYTLIVQGKYGAKNAQVQAEFPFTVTAS
jgi:hypothetical protein